MSEDTRADLVTSANLVDGIEKVTPHYRQDLKPRNGFVKWGGRVRDDSGLGWIDTWQVWIALSQDIKTAEKWLEDHLDQLVASIDVELVVTSANPAEMLLGDKTTNGLIIEGTRPAA